MKQFFTKGMAVLAAATFFISCSDDSNEGTGGNVPATGSYISASVDGSAFETYSVQGVTTAAATKSGMGDQTFITISASALNTTTMVVNLMGVNGTGTYELGPNSDTFIGYADTGSDVIFHSSADCNNVSGELKVTHFSDEKIEGTFSFHGADDECTGNKNVTNGKFRGVYMN